MDLVTFLSVRDMISDRTGNSEAVERGTSIARQAYKELDLIPLPKSMAVDFCFHAAFVDFGWQREKDRLRLRRGRGYGILRGFAAFKAAFHEGTLDIPAWDCEAPGVYVNSNPFRSFVVTSISGHSDEQHQRDLVCYTPDRQRGIYYFNERNR